MYSTAVLLASDGAETNVGGTKNRNKYKMYYIGRITYHRLSAVLYFHLYLLHW